MLMAGTKISRNPAARKSRDWTKATSSPDGFPNGFIVVLTDKSMEPCYDKGDTLIVESGHPMKPARDYLFIHENGQEYFGARFLKETPTHWHVVQINTVEDVVLSKRHWPIALKVRTCMYNEDWPRSEPKPIHQKLPKRQSVGEAHHG